MVTERPSRLSACLGILRSALLGFARIFIATIPPRDLTITRIGVTRIRIRAYWNTHGRVPPSLSDLPPTPGRDNATVDGWGRDILYQVKGSSTVTLTSLGADGEAGGTGLDEDIAVSFDASE
ncbi:type II secretion system protein GspG [Pseudomonas sp. BN102]|uniref:type II secretion system protein GspG n=1 Tax=Pseudomonas sp. BN102 TaxID=2567886 RepID=UPI002458709D|nr:type II secretion system protein GspG [Pseudomonas sp. BN102]MDH4607153.1 hypothetical protein [Pseudomonas sp. BN102]